MGRLKVVYVPKRRSLNISQQLRALGLAPFVGRQHSGIDVSIVLSISQVRTAVYLSHVRLYQWLGTCIHAAALSQSFLVAQMISGQRLPRSRYLHVEVVSRRQATGFCMPRFAV